MSIRECKDSDLQVVQDIESVSFSQYLSCEFKRSLENLKFHFEVCDGSAFVFEQEREIVGFIFSRAFGELGWIGTFAVKIDCQSRGVGKKLLQHAVNHLKEKGCKTIGLETLNSAYKNIEFYLKSGFSPVMPSFQLEKKISAGSAENKIFNTQFNQEYVEEISSKVWGGYNPVGYYKKAVEKKLADVLEIELNNKKVAVALLEKTSQKTVTVASLMFKDSCPKESYSSILFEIESFAFCENYSNIEIFINSQNRAFLNALLNEGYRIKNSRIRMLCQGNYTPSSVECSRWIM